VELLTRAVRIDSTDASLRYELARRWDARGDRAAAAREYRAARDFDGVPFRAPSDINRIVRRVAARGAMHVPLETVFDSLAIGPAPGLDLFLEHVHPRLRATDAMATAILRTMATHGLLPQRARADTLSWAEAAARQGVTELDEEIAERRIFHLTHRWPYPVDEAARFASHRDPLIQRIAEDVIANRLDLVAAHVALAERWSKDGRISDAFRELRSACVIFPVVPSRFATAGAWALDLGRPAEALEMFERAAALDPANPDYPRLVQAASERVRG
jgi:tetratricopeptide (TPR) repeat protein